MTAENMPNPTTTQPAEAAPTAVDIEEAIRSLLEMLDKATGKADEEETAPVTDAAS